VFVQCGYSFWVDLDDGAEVDVGVVLLAGGGGG